MLPRGPRGGGPPANRDRLGRSGPPEFLASSKGGPRIGENIQRDPAAPAEPTKIVRSHGPYPQEAFHILGVSPQSRTAPSPRKACRFPARSGRALPLSARLLRGDTLRPRARQARNYRDRAHDGAPRSDASD